MENWKNKVAIVTGAGQGIGAQITEDLVKLGMTVIGFEPTEEKVDKMLDNVNKWGKTEGFLVPCKCDISKTEDLTKAFEGIVTAYGGVDLLINNAAIGKEGLIANGNLTDMKNIVDVNISGLIACTHMVIKSMMKKSGAKQIININSICGHYMPNFAKPTINMYIASKKAMTAFTDALRCMLNSTKDFKNIKVLSLSPGIVKTDIFKAANIDFINDEFFEKNPYLSVKDVSNIVLLAMTVPQSIGVKEILFHALHEDICNLIKFLRIAFYDSLQMNDKVGNSKLHGRWSAIKVEAMYFIEILTMDLLSGKVAVVTNCATEIGHRIIENFIIGNVKVIGIVNNKNGKTAKYLEQIEAIEKNKEALDIYDCDVTDLNQIEVLFKLINKKIKHIDILINIIHCNEESYALNDDIEQIIKQTDTYVTANVYFLNLVTKKMLEKKNKSHIINLVEKRPGEKNIIYKTSTAAISSINEILRHELRYIQANIKTTTIVIEYEHENKKLSDDDIKGVKYASDFIFKVLKVPDNVQLHEIELYVDKC